MGVSERWKLFKNNKQYLSMIRYNSLQKLSQLIFGEPPEDLKIKNIPYSFSIFYFRFLNISFQIFLDILNYFSFNSILNKNKQMQKFYIKLLNLLKKLF
jgi:hypothetical protein